MIAQQAQSAVELDYMTSPGGAVVDVDRKLKTVPESTQAPPEDLEIVVGPEDETEQPPPDGGRQAWTAITCCSIITGCYVGQNHSWGVIQNRLVADKLSSAGTLSFIGALAIACISAFALINAYTLRRYGARSSCMVGMSLISIGQMISSFAHKNVGGLFVTSGLIVGLGTSLCFMSVSVLPAQYFVLRRGIANGVVYAGGGFGGAFFSLIIEQLLEKLGVAWTFRVLSFFSLAIGVTAAAFIKERRMRKSMSFIEWQLFKDGRFVLLGLAGALGTFPLLVPPFFLPLYAKTLGLSSLTGALLLAGWNLASAAGRLGFGHFGDKFGPVNSLLLSFIFSALSLLAIWPVSTSIAPLAVFVVVNGVSNGGFFSIMPTVVGAVFGPFRVAVVMGMIVTSWGGGYLMGAPIAGYILDAFGGTANGLSAFRPAMFYAGGVTIISALLVAAMRYLMTKKLWAVV